jgi:hypothetical protein
MMSVDKATNVNINGSRGAIPSEKCGSRLTNENCRVYPSTGKNWT